MTTQTELNGGHPELKARRRLAGPLAAGLVLGLILGAGATYLFTHAPHAHDPAAGAVAAAATRYQCPMHPDYTSDKKGDCPICGMKLVPIESAAAPRAAVAPGGKRTIAFYRSPMNPSQTSPVARKDEMGMSYVPVYEDEVSGAVAVPGLAAVQIDAQRQQLIGIRTAPVAIGALSDDWQTVGRIAIDETRVRKINVKVDGFVEKLYVDYVGKEVRRGQPLLSIYSPELLSVQNEYLVALQTKKALSVGRELASSGDDLVAAARRRLELWDIRKAEIDELERSRTPRRTLTIYSPISGVVTAKNVVQGSKISAGDMPFEITDLSQVWLLADAHEMDVARVRLGTPGSLKLQALPDRTFKGRVSFIQPVLDPKTRTAKVRLSFANPRGELKPDMFGEIVFHYKSRQGLRVPADSIIDSGERKIVFVALGEGRFEPREVTAGDAAGDSVEVKSGLKAGEQVVVRANFLVDSESRLKAALAGIKAKPATPEAGHPETSLKAGPPSPRVLGRKKPAASVNPHAGHGG